MSVERLERVLWRVRKNNPDASQMHLNELRRAIMLECGTDPRTFKLNHRALLTLKWIKPYKKTMFKLTDEDLK